MSSRLAVLTLSLLFVTGFGWPLSQLGAQDIAKASADVRPDKPAASFEQRARFANA